MTMIIRLVFFLTLTLAPGFVWSQSNFRFAFVSDTHVGSDTGAEDLRRTVKDINTDSSLAFVVITGDITEFGADPELQVAKNILDSLNKPWHIIPGNHDANWSESGGNSFKKVFGAETFYFDYGGYAFVGTASGPYMRMGPGQIPRENVMWLDSVLNHMPDPEKPVIFLNHYPQDSSLNNWYEVIDRLKKRNIQLVLCGHGHSNHRLDFEEIPAVMGRSNLRARQASGGYTVVDVTKDKAVFEEKTPCTDSLKKWTEVTLSNHHFASDTSRYPRPTYQANETYQNVKAEWQYQDSSDIGSGIITKGNLILCSNTEGELYALDKKNASKKWVFRTGGKIFATPAVGDEYAVIASTDQYIYCVGLKNGSLVWKYRALKPIVACPIIKDGVVYIGGSDGHFRALNLVDGKLIWDYSGVAGFVVTRPLIYGNIVYFGCWGNDFYALNIKSGSLVWKWNNGTANRMYSPAACYPVGAHGKIFIVAPDRYMTAMDAASGRVLWRKQMEGVRMRESMGLSEDSSLVYIKTMEGNLYGVSSTSDSMEIVWKANAELGYEISPTAIVEKDKTVYIPTNSGLVWAIDRTSGEVQWKYKVSNGLVSSILPAGRGHVMVSTMDGKISYLRFNRR